MLWEDFWANLQAKNHMRPETQEEAAGKEVQASIFAEAEEIINGPRAEDYGDARFSFGQIADLWSAYLQMIVTPADVEAMMALLKLVRLKYSGFTHHDSFVDMLGYVGLAHKISVVDKA